MGGKRAVAFATMLGLLTAGVPAAAQTIEEARRAADEGRFVDAADIGEAVNTSESYALAARFLAIYGYHVAPEDEKQGVFERAMADAAKAVRLDAANPEAHVQSAHAMGRYAQTIGAMEAFSEGFAERTRDAMFSALALDPDFVTAHLALAGWHAEIVAKAGFMAGVLYGATEEDALAHYETARKLAPDSSIVNYDYALGLLKLDDDGYAEKAGELLRHAIAIPVTTAYGEIIRAAAERALAALDER